MSHRREFLATMARLGIGVGFAPLVAQLLGCSREATDAGDIGSNPRPALGTASAAETLGRAEQAAQSDTDADRHLRPAKYWRSAEGEVACELCPRQELLTEGQWGRCHVRQNRGGSMVTHGYNRPCILNVDPIEKNPLGHVLPGAEMLAVAHAGCMLRCLYCQNWEFSQRSPEETRNLRDFRQKESLEKARERKLRGIAFTYTEPTNCPEFLGDMANLAKSMELVPTLCTCGFVRAKALAELLAPFAAVTITYKGPSEDFYEKACSARLQPVLDAMLLVKREAKWLEVATLVVPTLNDDPAGLKTMANWMVKNLGPDTPWHLERFQPQYKLKDLPRTPQSTMETARKIGLDAGLKYVYISNLAPHEGNHTYCPGCGKAVVKRLGFKILANDLKNGRCPDCRTALPGLWT